MKILLAILLVAVALPADALPSFFDDPAHFNAPLSAEDIASQQSDVLAEIALIRSELAGQLAQAEPVTPSDPGNNGTDQIPGLAAGELFAVGSALADPDAVANAEGRYRVCVVDAEGNGVAGALIQFCDDATCAFLATDADGMAAFEADAGAIYEVHVLQTPEGFQPNGTVYHTLAVYSDVTVTLQRTE